MPLKDELRTIILKTQELIQAVDDGNFLDLKNKSYNFSSELSTFKAKAFALRDKKINKILSSKALCY